MSYLYFKNTFFPWKQILINYFQNIIYFSKFIFSKTKAELR